MTDIKKPIAVKFPKFDNNIENPYQDEMDKIIEENLATAGTSRTLKNITECLTKGLRSKYDIKDKEKLKELVNLILKTHGLSEQHFDPLATISKLVFGNQQTVNDISIDDNANKTETNMEGIQGEAFLPFKKLAGYDYIYQVIRDLEGKEKAKECMADMFDFSLVMNDSTNILKPYCYCIDASKIVTEGRKFGQVHSSPAKRVSTYISILGDTIREISFNLAGAIAIGTFFLDIAHLSIYRERITLDELRNNKQVRKSMINHFQQFIHTVNHYSRNAVESPFTNVSIFDRTKLRGLIDEDNYGWYFEIKPAVIEDNNLEGYTFEFSDDASREEKRSLKEQNRKLYTEFVLDYIEELQELYLEEFDKGDPLRGGLQFPFPVTTVNLGITINPDGTRELTEKNNKTRDFICKKDISRYNIYASEGTKVASCCRLLSDAEMMSMSSGVNSFGGSQVSLGSHRVVTVNMARCAYEAESYDSFKEILTHRIENAAKILKAHRVLIHKLEELGTQPWISNGWINMSHMFSTFGCIGYLEADEILKKKFNHKDFDYMKDFLTFFNEECRKAAQKEEILFNIEGIPGESTAHKLAKVDNALFGGDYKLYANQWSSLWEDYTIKEKMERDGEIQKLMTGGSIVHFSVDSKLTSAQARHVLDEAINCGCAHFAFNCVYTRCLACGSVHTGDFKVCPDCLNDDAKRLEHYSRIIGYFSKVEGWNETRREKDFPNRKFYHEEDLKKQLGD